MFNKTTTLLFILCFSTTVLFAQSDEDNILNALKTSDSKKLEELFAAGADPNIKNANKDPYLVTAAIWPELLSPFIKAGGDVNDGGKTDYTPLMMAVSMSGPESTKMLIDAGADVNYAQKSTGMTALHFATWKSNCLKCVEHLLKAGANVNAQDKNKETPATIMVTAMSPAQRATTVQYTTTAFKNYGFENLPDRFTNPKEEDWDKPTDIMGLLLNYNLDPDLKNKVGVNALMNAAYYNKVEIMAKLVQSGAKLNAKDKSKKTVWTYAIDGGAGDALAYMVKNKIAKVDEGFVWYDEELGINMKDMTALSLAALNGSPENIKILLEMGAQCDAKSSGTFYSNGCQGIMKDKTPLVYAIESGELENVKAIIENCDKKKVWHAWSAFEVKPTALAKFANCYGGRIWIRPWTYAEAMNLTDISEYLKNVFDEYTLGKN